MLLNQAEYKLYPYENDLHKKEISNFLNLEIVSVHNKEYRLNKTSDHEKLKRLTYTKSYTIDDRTFFTDQYLLESFGDNKKSQSTRYSVHGLHEYKGKFNPQIVKSIMNILDVPNGQTILDPFCGSGTSLIESLHSGINSIGLDINPFAVYLSNAKIKALKTSTTELNDLFIKILNIYNSNDKYEPKFETARYEYLLKWFEQEYLIQIERYREIVLQIAPQFCEIFLILASNVLRDFSLQDPMDLRIRRRPYATPDLPFIKKVSDQYEALVNKITYTHECIGKITNSAVAYNSDIRLKQSFQSLIPSDLFAVITSPPYATALPYIDTQRLSIVWLDIAEANEILSLESSLIGSREFKKIERAEISKSLQFNHEKIPVEQYDYCKYLENQIGSQDGFRRKAMPTLIYRYFSDMQKMFSNIRNIVSINTPYALVIGRNHTVLGGTRIDIDTTYHLASIAQANGWAVSEIIPLQTYQRYGYHQNNAINKEDLLILRAAK